MASCVYVRTLLVHYVIVFEQMLTYTEVVFLDAFLGFFDAVIDHFVFEHLAFLESESVKEFHDSVVGIYTHQLVLKGYVEHRSSGVALTAGTTA